MKFRPLKNKIIVKQYEVETETDSGIIVETDTRNYKKPQRGIILAVGDKVQDLDLKEGVHIFFSMYAGANVWYKKHHLLVLNETEVFGIISEDADLSVGKTDDTEALLEAIDSHGLFGQDQF